MASMESLNTLLAFWDSVAYLTLSLVFVGVVGETIVEWKLVSWLTTPSSRKSTVGKASALLLIAGLGGEMIVHAKISEYSGEIIALLNTQARNADDRSSAAIERSKILERDVEVLRKENNKLSAQIKGVVISTGDREMSIAERDQLKKSLRGQRHEVTLIMVDEREARLYAIAIQDALEDAGVLVKTEEAKTSRFYGVIVCESGTRDIALRKALNHAAIEAKSINQKNDDRPEFCDIPAGSPHPANGVGSIIGNTLDKIISGDFFKSPRRGTVVFVGQKVPRALPQQ